MQVNLWHDAAVAYLLLINSLLLMALLVKPVRANRQVIHLLKEIKHQMATQEERLQAISLRIDEVLQMLADLRTNNPQIEDEIAEIEAKLAPPEPEP